MEKIDIASAEKDESLIVERKESEIVVNPKSSEPKIWKVFKREGEIPREFLRPEQVFNNKYEIKIAIPDEAVEVNKLFVFFPTEVRFPFPIIAHATFEVGDNRQHLIDSEVNRFIAEKLADLMAESAEQVKDVNNPWYALSAISPRGDIDSVLEKFGFLEMLEKSIREYALLPVRNKKFGKPSVSKRIKGNFDSLLIGDMFSDLCIYSDDYSIKKQLDRLGVNYVGYNDLKERLNKIADQLSLDSRADIIYSLVQNDLIDGEPPELLIDEHGERISVRSSVFLPAEKKVFSLPSWVSQKILSSELTMKLRDNFSVSRVRDVASNLSSFNVQEYNMNSLVSSISAETNRRAKDEPQEELALRQQMVQAIWSLYSSSTEKVKLREEITVILPARNGAFDAAQNLYLGKEYAGGKVLEYLYAHIDAALFVASPGKLDFSDDSLEVEDFLCWLGVNRSPRYKKANFNYGDFHDNAISSLNYPAKFEEIIIWNPAGPKECYVSLGEVSCIDRLEEVLSSADPHAIISWIATAPDVESWRLNKDTEAGFRIKQPYQQKYRRLSGQVIPSHPLWLLKNVKWLPTSGGNKLSPVKCSLARVARDLEPVIGYPAINMEHPLIKELNLDLTAIRNALVRVGVATNLDELPWDSFYEVLLEDEIIADALGEIVSNLLKVDVNNEIARLSSCSSGKRDLLLDRLVGGSGKERMAKTGELLKTTKDKEEDFPEPSPWTPPPKADKQEAPAEELVRDSSSGEATKPDEVGNVEARDLGAPVPLINRKVVARRIQENPKTREGSHSKKMVNPDRAENLAKSFEEFQGRCAEKVSHIRGLEGYGCDILSFKTQGDLDSFKGNNNPDIVERFIEVKGSANEKGPVSLGGNELNSAQTHREKFFVYRIYEDGKTGILCAC